MNEWMNTHHKIIRNLQSNKFAVDSQKDLKGLIVCELVVLKYKNIGMLL